MKLFIDIDKNPTACISRILGDAPLPLQSLFFNDTVPLIIRFSQNDTDPEWINDAEIKLALLSEDYNFLTNAVTATWKNGTAYATLDLTGQAVELATRNEDYIKTRLEIQAKYDDFSITVAQQEFILFNTFLNPIEFTIGVPVAPTFTEAINVSTPNLVSELEVTLQTARAPTLVQAFDLTKSRVEDNDTYEPFRPLFIEAEILPEPVMPVDVNAQLHPDAEAPAWVYAGILPSAIDQLTVAVVSPNKPSDVISLNVDDLAPIAPLAMEMETIPLEPNQVDAEAPPATPDSIFVRGTPIEPIGVVSYLDTARPAGFFGFHPDNVEAEIALPPVEVDRVNAGLGATGDPDLVNAYLDNERPAGFPFSQFGPTNVESLTEVTEPLDVNSNTVWNVSNGTGQTNIEPLPSTFTKKLQYGMNFNVDTYGSQYNQNASTGIPFGFKIMEEFAKVAEQHFHGHGQISKHINNKQGSPEAGIYYQYTEQSSSVGRIDPKKKSAHFAKPGFPRTTMLTNGINFSFTTNIGRETVGFTHMTWEVGDYVWDQIVERGTPLCVLNGFWTREDYAGQGKWAYNQNYFDYFQKRNILDRQLNTRGLTKHNIFGITIREWAVQTDDLLKVFNIPTRPQEYNLVLETDTNDKRFIWKVKSPTHGLGHTYGIFGPSYKNKSTHRQTSDNMGYEIIDPDGNIIQSEDGFKKFPEEIIYPYQDRYNTLTCRVFLTAENSGYGNDYELSQELTPFKELPAEPDQVIVSAVFGPNELEHELDVWLDCSDEDSVILETDDALETIDDTNQVNYLVDKVSGNKCYDYSKYLGNWTEEVTSHNLYADGYSLSATTSWVYYNNYWQPPFHRKYDGYKRSFYITTNSRTRNAKGIQNPSIKIPNLNISEGGRDGFMVISSDFDLFRKDKTYAEAHGWNFSQYHGRPFIYSLLHGANVITGGITEYFGIERYGRALGKGVNAYWNSRTLSFHRSNYYQLQRVFDKEGDSRFLGITSRKGEGPPTVNDYSHLHYKHFVKDSIFGINNQHPHYKTGKIDFEKLYFHPSEQSEEMQILKDYFDGKSHFKYDNNPKELLAKEGLDYTVLPDADLSSGEINPQGRKLTNLIHWNNTKSRDIVLKNWDNEIFKDASVPLETFLDNLKENFYEFNVNVNNSFDGKSPIWDFSTQGKFTFAKYSPFQPLGELLMNRQKELALHHGTKEPHASLDDTFIGAFTGQTNTDPNSQVPRFYDKLHTLYGMFPSVIEEFFHGSEHDAKKITPNPKFIRYVCNPGCGPYWLVGTKFGGHREMTSATNTMKHKFHNDHFVFHELMSGKSMNNTERTNIKNFLGAKWGIRQFFDPRIFLAQGNIKENEVSSIYFPNISESDPTPKFHYDGMWKQSANDENPVRIRLCEIHQRGTINGAKASYIKIAKGDDSTENVAILDWDYARNRLAGGDTETNTRMRVLWNEIVRNYFMDQSDIEPFEVNEEFDANGYPVNAEREEIIT